MIQRITQRTGTALLGTLLLAAQGCGVSADKAMAQAAVASFHNQLDEAQYAAMWEDTDEIFRNASSRENYEKLTSAVHRKLGLVVRTATVNWSLNYKNFQTWVVLQQKTQFEHGAGVETFTYIVRGNSVKLVAWNINSNDLITL